MKLPLPDILPAGPLPLLEQWLAEAVGAIRNATALATVEPDGRPSAHMVLCRGLDVREGRLVFYTDRDSDTGRALALLPRAAAVFHRDAFERQGATRLQP
jgi:pyridoxamine 5'-phosphate oxidase